MRNKKRFFSGFLAALMLLSVGLPVLAEELPEAESKPVCTCSARCNARLHLRGRLFGGRAERRLPRLPGGSGGLHGHPLG